MRRRRSVTALIVAVLVGLSIAATPAPASADPLLPLPLPTLPLPLPTLPPILPLPLPTLPPLLPRPPAPAPSAPAPPAPAPQQPNQPAPGQPAPAPDAPNTPAPNGPAPNAPAPAAPGSLAAPDGFPELPFDPVTTPSAAQVQALYTALKRIQALQNEIAAGTARLTTARSVLTSAEATVNDAAGRRDQAGRGLFMGRAESPLSIRPPSMLTALGVDATDLRIKEVDRAVHEIDRAQSAADQARGEVASATVALATARRELVRQQAAAAALRAPVDQTARTAVATAPDTSVAGYTGGRLLRPVNGPLSSPFGNRYDPYYHVWQLHAGLDLAAGAGTPIRAAAAGTVLRAGWFGGYGNYTCIAHGLVRGQRLMTCYGHQSQLLVRAGQRVSAGQVIGRVGSTGASTGPHLHFEVRLGGRPVDPRPWL